MAPTDTSVPPTDTPEPTNTPLPPTSTPTPVSADIVYVSSSSGGSVGGVSFKDEDILAFDTGTQTWSMYFDGSDVGVTADLNAFYLDSDGTILMSFQQAVSIGNLGTVDDSDIIRFEPTSLGAETAGNFSLYFDGSDVGLSKNGEDIDALHVFTDGRIVVSTTGSFSVSGASGKDEDLFIFTPTSIGSTTTGSWAMYFDGSDVGLNSSSSEDVNGTWIDSSSDDIYLSTLNSFSAGLSGGDGSDIFICHPTMIGSSTDCNFGPGLYWDGSENGFAGERVDGFFIGR